MANSDKTFQVGGKTFRLNIKEKSFFFGGELVKAGDFCTAKKYEKQRELASKNDLLCSQVIKASDELEAENKTLSAENTKLKAELKKATDELAKLKGGK